MKHLANILPLLFAAAFLPGPGLVHGQPNGEVKFAMHRIGTFRSEACCVGDFNNDGKLDIVAGPYLYLAPDWKPQKIRELSGSVDNQGKGYYDDFMNQAVDVDGDGWLDVVSASWFNKRSTWYRNPGKSGELWAEAVVENNGNFEAGDLWDLFGNGKHNVVVPTVQRTVWYELGKRPDGSQGLTTHVVSEKQLTWGVGVGDVNGDGRPDILRPNAWFEQPRDIRNGQWTEHAWALSNKDGRVEDTAQIGTMDVNGDGLSDVIYSSAHGYGVFWCEQVRRGSETQWIRHLIDDTWTQVHSLTLADIDGDGIPEIIAGKRFMAHNGGDPDEFGPLGVYYYTLKRDPKPVWTKHAITYNQGIGSGMNIVAIDLTGSGRIDIVTTGKFGGPVWFQNLGTKAP